MDGCWRERIGKLRALRLKSKQLQARAELEKAIALHRIADAFDEMREFLKEIREEEATSER